MNTCPFCNHELVNIIYGYPSEKLIQMAKEENFALGGKITTNSPTHYCYGCNEAI
jgi:hypothetical protein